MRDAAINLIKALAGQYEVDPDFALKIAKHESDFNPQATSPKGAMGVMQLMPGTAKLLGVKNPYDMEQNIHGGLKYIAGLQKQFPGRPDLVAAAYNAGPHRVTQYGNQVPPFAETQKFVQNVTGDKTPIFSKPEVGMANPLRSDMNAGQALIGMDASSPTQSPVDINQLLSIVQAAAGPQRAPIPTGQVMPQNEVVPATSERGMQLAQVLGALAGIAGPQYAQAGGAIAGLATKELDRARKDRAAQAVGFRTWQELEAAKGAAEADYTGQMARTAGVKGLESAAKTTETLAELPSKQAYPVVLGGEGNAPIYLTSAQMADKFFKGEEIKFHNRKLDEHDIPAMQSLRAYHDIMGKLHTRDIPMTLPDPANPGKVIQAMGTISDSINLLARTDPAKAAKLTAGWNILNKFSDAYEKRVTASLANRTPLTAIKPTELFTPGELKAFDAILPDLIADKDLAPMAVFVQKTLGLVPKRKGLTYPSPVTPLRPGAPRPQGGLPGTSVLPRPEL